MKKSLLVVLFLGELSIARLTAQGTVVFANASSTAGWYDPTIDRYVHWDATVTGYNPLLVPGGLVSSNYAGLDLSSLRAALYYAEPAITDLPRFSLASGSVSTFKRSTSTTAGSWFTKSATLDTIPYGFIANVIVVVWDTNLSTDPLSPTAQSGLWGRSALLQYTPPAAGPPNLELLQDLRAFTVGVPEPSPLVMLGLFILLTMLWVKGPAKSVRQASLGRLQKNQTLL